MQIFYNCPICNHKLQESKFKSWIYLSCSNYDAGDHKINIWSEDNDNINLIHFMVIEEFISKKYFYLNVRSKILNYNDKEIKYFEEQEFNYNKFLNKIQIQLAFK